MRIYKNGELQLWPLWLLGFLYSIGVAVAIQWVLLPYIFPSWHAGNGLLVRGDWIKMHECACEQADLIRAIGWKAWELHPPPWGWVESGLASAIYAVTGIYSPSLLIPFNAIIHATSFLVTILLLLKLFPESGRWSLWGALPRLLFPSTLIWVAQIHKDGLSILGATLFIYGWALIYPRDYRVWKTGGLGALLVLIGTILQALMRPYLNQIFLFLAFFYVALIVVQSLRLYRAKTIGAQMATLYVFSAFVYLGITSPIYVHGVELFQASEQKAIEAQILELKKEYREKRKLRSNRKDNLGEGETTDSRIGSLSLEEIPLGNTQGGSWKMTSILPAYLDSRLYTAGAIRNGYLSYSDSKSMIDSDWRFSSARDMGEYFPRALQIALFAPFPDQWVGKGSSDSQTTFRKIVSIEILLFYFLLPTLIWLFIKYYYRLDLWMVFAFYSVPTIIYAYVVPVMGAFHRFRFGFATLIIGIGIAAFPKFYESACSILRRKQNPLQLQESN